MKRSGPKHQGNHPLAALGSFFTGGKNAASSGGPINRADDLGSDGMSGSGSASGSSGVNNSAVNGLRITSTDNSGGFLVGGSSTLTRNSSNIGLKHHNSSFNQNNVDGCGTAQNNNLVMPLAAVHAAMASATLDRQFHSSWRNQLNHLSQMDSAQGIPTLGRPLFARNNSLGHAILPSQNQNTKIPFAIDPKYDSDSDFDYRQRPPR